MILVREATPEDVAQMHQMINELAEYEKALEEVIATEHDLMKALFGRDFSSPEFDQHDSISASGVANTPHGQPALYALVAEDPHEPDQIAGMAIWFLNYSTWDGSYGVYLEDLYVRPQFRGQGMGKALMKRLAQVCVENEYSRFQWWVLDWNQPAIEVYRSMGATDMDEWTVYRVTGQELRDLASD
jgi:ribosomal protein S18 acetylase RimI-like enzyme